MNVFEHTTHGSDVQYLTYFMMVRIRLGLGYWLVLTKGAIFILATESMGQMKWGTYS